MLSSLQRTGLLLLFFLPISAVQAQTTSGDKMIEDFLAATTNQLNKTFLDGATTLEEWQARRPRLRQEYLDMLGLWPLPEKTPLDVKVTGTIERDGVVIEKLHYQSRPRLYVTGNLYRPKKVEGKLPGVLYVCGHSGRGRDGNKTAYQDHGLWFASNGYICLVVDTLQLGEIAGIHHGTYREGRWWWQALGYTPAGVECWNGIRGIDYLISRPDVDASRITVTGISGGGASTMWIAAADERVRCAVPVSGMSDLESYVKNKVINGHCDCMFLVNSHGWEWTTIAALIAPRPLLFANSDNDRIFPMDGNRRIIARLRQIYKLYGKPELVDDYVSVGGHAYRPDLRKAIFQWINLHIKNDKQPVQDADFKPLEGKELRVFPEDRDIPQDALNGRIDESFVPRAKIQLPEAKGFAEWKASMLKKLRAESFRTFPERIPPAKQHKKYEAKQGKNGWTLITQDGIEVLLLDSFAEKKGSQTGVLLVLNPEEEWELTELPSWSRAFAEGGVVRVLVPRGGGPFQWTRKSPPNYVERAHALLGHTVDEGRVWDIAATVRFLDAESKGKIRWKVVGRGQAGILAAYAALLEPSIAEVAAIESPASHDDGPIFLNVLRVLDIPEALGLLAPRPLTLTNARDKDFERTRTIYHRGGAEKQLKLGSPGAP